MDYKDILRKRLVRGIIFFAFGALCGVLYGFKIMNNTVLPGLAIGFGGYGIARIIDYFRKTKNENTLNKSFIEEYDERNRILWGHAKCTAFDITAFAGAVLTIVFIAIGWEERGTIVAYTVCSMVVIAYICYLVFKKKY